MVSQSDRTSGDPSMLDQVIAEYLQAEATGRAGDRQQWFDRYPSCAQELREFFEDRERIARLVVPMRFEKAAVDVQGRGTDVFVNTDPNATIENANYVPPCTHRWGGRYRLRQFH